MKRPHLIFVILVLLLGGCATTATYPPKALDSKVPGVYHEVKRGETLYRICKTYNARLEDVVKTNRLPDASKIVAGQLIFIPGEIEKPVEAKIKPASGAEGFVWPVRGKVVSYFGSTKDLVKNDGIDIEAKPGDVVVSARSGKVVFCDEKVKGYGKTVIIDHGDGFQTVYAHNAEILAKVGDQVGQKQAIARVGSTGAVDKPTLHFEIRKDNKAQNPFYYLP